MTGASIAGPAAAWWLARIGYDVTVVERADALRPGGQNIDVRGTGREVARRMGLEDAVKARNTGEVGTRFVDEDGATLAEFEVDHDEGRDGPTAELEILRGALSEILVDACKDDVEWRFGVSIERLEQDDDSVHVTLSDGSTESYDLLVVAEGVGSRTRDLVFEAEERPLGMYAVYATIPRTEDDDDWWRALVVEGSRQLSLRPDDEGTTRANLNYLVDEPELDRLSEAERRAKVRERYEGVGWEAERILDGFDAADDLYADYLRQIHCETWHRGRVVLLGDAAWCVTPLGGIGTSLALTGAYVLASYLSQHDDHETALERYEEWMRPLVDEGQDLPPGVPRIAAPRTRAGVTALRWGIRAAGWKPVQRVAGTLLSGPGQDRELPPEPRSAA